MMPPAYVKPYIRRQKNDASDAAAICEAVTRPSMRFVGVRSLMNQAALKRHKARGDCHGNLAPAERESKDSALVQAVAVAARQF